MKFKYNPRIIKHLGTELITSDEIAITELIKNSYDAKANKVKIHFLSSYKELNRNNLLTKLPLELGIEIGMVGDSPFIVLEDDGSGMSLETLRDGFFEIGSDLKAKAKINQSEDDEIILGDKGIGRLSAQRLSQILFVETKSAQDETINVVKIDWNKFITSQNEDAPEILIPKKDGSSYTRLWFFSTETHPINFEKYFEYRKNTQVDLFENKIELEGGSYYVKDDLQSALSFLYSPF